MAEILEGIRWLGHASFQIVAGDKFIYFDPWKIKGEEPKADLIFITHSHYDHCSPEDVQKLVKDTTVVVGPQDTLSQIACQNKQLLLPGETRPIGGFKVTGVPAYNIKRNFHSQKEQWLGYIIEVEGRKIYHTGDTDFIPEMEGIQVDIMLVSIGGTYTMDYQEAAEAVRRINPKIAVPMHYGTVVGSLSEAQKFAELASPVPVKILSSTC